METRKEFTARIMEQGFKPSGGNAETALLFTLPTELSGVPEAWIIRADECKALHYGFTPAGLVQRAPVETVYLAPETNPEPPKVDGLLRNIYGA